MKSENKKSVLRIGLIVAVAAAVLVAAILIRGNDNNNLEPDQKLGGQTYERASYNIFGTASSSTGPGFRYADNQKTLLSGGLENLHLDISYTPSTTDAVLYVLVEGSNDDGVTFFPMSTKTVGTTDIKMYTEGATSTVGIPILVPGDSTSVAATELKGAIDFDMVADHVRISIQEDTTANEGLVYIRATLTNKK